MDGGLAGMPLKTHNGTAMLGDRVTVNYGMGRSVTS